MKVAELFEADEIKPPWYKRSLNQLAKYKANIESKTSPFPRSELKVLPKAPDKRIPSTGWIGTWNVDFTGVIQIYIEQKFWDECIAKEIEWELVHVLQHEYMEAKLSIAAARDKHPDKNPYSMADKDESLGGEAHYETIKQLDGISSEEYENWISKIDKYLKGKK